MAIALVRRIVYAGFGVWLFVMAFEESRSGGHAGATIGLGIAGIVLLALAATGKGG